MKSLEHGYKEGPDVRWAKTHAQNCKATHAADPTLLQDLLVDNAKAVEPGAKATGATRFGREAAAVAAQQKTTKARCISS